MPVPAGGDGATDLYTSLETVKTSLTKLTTNDKDDLIEGSIRAACRVIDRRCGRRFYADPVASPRTFPVLGQSLLRDCDHVLLVDDIASEAGMQVASGSAGSWSALSGWTTGPDNALAYGRAVTEIFNSRGWLPSSGRVQVTAVWGWPAVPDEISEAARLLSARLYRRKDSPEGVLGSAEWGVSRVSRTDPDVEALIAPFVLPVIA